MPPRTSTRSIPVIALLTDFGLSDHYVAAMKGVIASHDPRIRVIDISHTIEPGRIQAGGYALWAVQHDLPPGTVCIGVVDPGVGTDRDILCALVDGRTYLAPDNGLLDMVLASCRTAELFRLSMTKVGKMVRPLVTRTFHGRDIFAPIGARLATGTPPLSVGVKKKFHRPTEWRVVGPSSKIAPTILSVDWFGNVITNIVIADAAALRKQVRAVSIGKVMISVVADTFDGAPDNTPCLIVGSSGMVEVVLKGGHAARVLRVNDRSTIRIVWSENAG